jgi:transposase-like protein
MSKLTGRQEKAAVLAAEDRYSVERIAEKIGVTRRTLALWRQQPLFAARVWELTEELATLARRRGIARRERRLAVLQETHNKLLQVIEERAADPTMSEIPGGLTGLVVRKPVISTGKVAGHEYAVDNCTIAELRKVQEQAAKELGQLVERHEHRVISSLRDLSDEELEALAAELQPPGNAAALATGDSGLPVAALAP